MGKVRKMLGKADSPYILSMMRLIETQSKVTIATWCIDYSDEHFLPIYENACPDDSRPRRALEAGRAWLRKEIKLPEAKTAILECHSAAREAESDPVIQAAARTIGQAASSIHTPTHSLGLAFYGAAVFAYSRYGVDESAEFYDRIAAEVCGQMEASLRAVSAQDEPDPARIKWYC